MAIVTETRQQIRDRIAALLANAQRERDARIAGIEKGFRQIGNPTPEQEQTKEHAIQRAVIEHRAAERMAKMIYREV
jgi:hypothetical protein